MLKSTLMILALLLCLQTITSLKINQHSFICDSCDEEKPRNYATEIKSQEFGVKFTIGQPFEIIRYPNYIAGFEAKLLSQVNSIASLEVILRSGAVNLEKYLPAIGNVYAPLPISRFETNVPGYYKKEDALNGKEEFITKIEVGTSMLGIRNLAISTNTKQNKFMIGSFDKNYPSYTFNIKENQFLYGLYGTHSAFGIHTIGFIKGPRAY